SATTEKPRATSGSTNDVSWAARPPQPWSSATAGPRPHRQAATRRPATNTASGSASRSADRPLEPRAGGGVKNIHSPTIAASEGAVRTRTRSVERISDSRTFVRKSSLRRPGFRFPVMASAPGLGGPRPGRSRGPRRPRRLDERVEGLARALGRPGVPEQPPRVMVGQHDAVEVVRDLFAVELGPEVAFGDPGARDVGDQLEPVALLAHELVAGRPLEIVELSRGSDEKTAPLEDRGFRPREPVLEDRPQPPLAPRSLERRPHHAIDEQLGRVTQRLDLQRLLRPEVREEPALREAQVGRELPDRQAFETQAARVLRGPLEDQLASLVTLAHTLNLARSFVLSRGPMNGPPKGLASVEDDGAVAVDEHAAPHVQAYGPRQHDPLEVASLADHVLHRVAVAHAHHVLLDDRPFVELLGDVVGGRADHLDPAGVRLVVGPAA